MINVEMIGVYSGNHVDKNGIKTYTLEPVILHEDFKKNRMQGFHINNRIVYKYWDDTGYFEIKETRISQSDKKIIENLKVADVVTFNYHIEDSVSSVFYNNDGNIITNIEKYDDSNALSKIRNLALSKIVRYLFTNPKPVNAEEQEKLINQMRLQDLSPATIKMYEFCRSVHGDSYIDLDDILFYVSGWLDGDIKECITELIDAGYLLEDPIDELIDGKTLPSYLNQI
jgi:predicted phosphatase